MTNSQILQRFEPGKPLSQLCTFKIGGPARAFVEIHTLAELQDVLHYCKENSEPFFLLGKGSNCLFHDRGFDGLVICNKIAFCSFEWPHVHVGAGYSFSLLGSQVSRLGWSGMEFASGIPGSVGGAIYMNAGANGSDVSQVLTAVSYLTLDGHLETLERDQLSFSYRTSSFQNKKGAIVSATFSLTSSASAREKQRSLIDYRMRTQPYQDPSAGCVFRNPVGYSAGALIEKSGLKGIRIGDAEVSLIHANFIVNKGDATAENVLQLAELVKMTVKEKTGIDLEMEMRCIPYRIE